MHRTILSWCVLCIFIHVVSRRGRFHWWKCAMKHGPLHPWPLWYNHIDIHSKIDGVEIERTTSQIHPNTHLCCSSVFYFPKVKYSEKKTLRCTSSKFDTANGIFPECIVWKPNFWWPFFSAQFCWPFCSGLDLDYRLHSVYRRRLVFRKLLQSQIFVKRQTVMADMILRDFGTFWVHPACFHRLSRFCDFGENQWPETLQRLQELWDIWGSPILVVRWGKWMKMERRWSAFKSQWPVCWIRLVLFSEFRNCFTIY